MCGKSGVINNLGDDENSNDSDGEDLEAYNGFTGWLMVIHVERTAAV